MSGSGAVLGSVQHHGSVKSALDVVDTTFQRISAVVDQIEAKLDPVMRQDGSGEGPNIGRPISATPLSGRIDALNDVLLAELSRLEYILERVDI